MTEETKRRVGEMLAFARYLSWAELLKNQYCDALEDEPTASDKARTSEHKWKCFGLMSYWYSSLYVVLEGWDKSGYSDPIVDSLLSHPKDFRALLRRYRNVVFHSQSSLLDQRFIELLAHGASTANWIDALHHEIVRFLAEYMDGLMATDEQRTEIRASIEQTIGWIPNRRAPELDKLGQTLKAGKELLENSRDEGSDARRELHATLEGAESTLQIGIANWETLREEILRKADFSWSDHNDSN